jgi:hypothetical protein
MEMNKKPTIVIHRFEEPDMNDPRVRLEMEQRKRRKQEEENDYQTELLRQRIRAREAAFLQEREQWIREHPGRNNPFRDVEYDRATGQLLPPPPSYLEVHPF